jgi:hypothetical protein
VSVLVPTVASAAIPADLIPGGGTFPRRGAYWRSVICRRIPLGGSVRSMVRPARKEHHGSRSWRRDSRAARCGCSSTSGPSRDRGMARPSRPNAPMFATRPHGCAMTSSRRSAIRWAVGSDAVASANRQGSIPCQASRHAVDYPRRRRCTRPRALLRSRQSEARWHTQPLPLPLAAQLTKTRCAPCRDSSSRTKVLLLQRDITNYRSRRAGGADGADSSRRRRGSGAGYSGGEPGAWRRHAGSGAGWPARAAAPAAR